MNRVQKIADILQECDIEVLIVGKVEVKVFQDCLKIGVCHSDGGGGELPADRFE